MSAKERNQRWRSKIDYPKWVRQWRRKNPERNMLIGVRASAKRRGILCTLTLKDIEIPKKCPVLGVVFKGQKNKLMRPSVDRIKSTRGYVKGNIRIVSGLANAMKNKATPSQLKKFAKWVLKTY